MTYSDLDNNNSTYNIDIHLPVPSQSYIKSVARVNLGTTGHELFTDVDDYIKGMTEEAKDYLFRNRLKETQDVMKYLFAFNKSWRESFINYVAKFIKVNLLMLDEKMIDNAINSNGLNVYLFTPNIIYEVKYSELEW